MPRSGVQHVGHPHLSSLVANFRQHLGLTNTDAEWINGIYFAGHLIAVPMLISLTDRTSPKKIYLCSLGLGGLSSLGFATLTGGIWAAMLFRTLGGVVLLHGWLGCGAVELAGGFRRRWAAGFRRHP